MKKVDKISREAEPVLHVNIITGDDNQRIFCKKQHSLEKVSDLQCGECSYFEGTGQGDTIQCVWDDLPMLSGAHTRVIYPGRQAEEYTAVSMYIDDGTLKKG